MYTKEEDAKKKKKQQKKIHYTRTCIQSSQVNNWQLNANLQTFFTMNANHMPHIQVLFVYIRVCIHTINEITSH